MKDLMGIVFILIILFFVWFFFIGPNKDTEKPFIKPAAPVDTGATYGPQ